jgi:hypothetical protein
MIPSAKPEQMSLPTAAGDALAVRLAGGIWRLTTPWSEELYSGDKTGAFKRLRAQVWEAEADPEHNSVHQAVQSAILFITAPLRDGHDDFSAEQPHEATWVIERPVSV